MSCVALRDAVKTSICFSRRVSTDDILPANAWITVLVVVVPVTVVAVTVVAVTEVTEVVVVLETVVVVVFLPRTQARPWKPIADP